MLMTADARKVSESAPAQKTTRDIYLPPARKEVTGGGDAHIAAKDFSIYYGEFEAVKKISADILSKYVTAIIGPSSVISSMILSRNKASLVKTSSFGTSI